MICRYQVSGLDIEYDRADKEPKVAMLITMSKKAAKVESRQASLASLQRRLAVQAN